MYNIRKDSKIRRGIHLQNWFCNPNLHMQLINYHFSIDLYLQSTVAQCTSNFLALSIFLQFLKMAPAPNFGVFLDFAHPFITEVDLSISIDVTWVTWPFFKVDVNHPPPFMTGATRNCLLVVNWPGYSSWIPDADMIDFLETW